MMGVKRDYTNIANDATVTENKEVLRIAPIPSKTEMGRWLDKSKAQRGEVIVNGWEVR